MVLLKVLYHSTFACWIKVYKITNVYLSYCMIVAPTTSNDIKPVETRLTAINKIEVEFVKMTTKIKEVLRNNDVSVGLLVEQLCSISSVKTKKVPLFDEDVFEKIKSIDELWRKLTKYWGIFDYDILLIVIDISGCLEAQQILESFLARIDPSAFEDMDLVLHCKVYKEEDVMRPLLRIKVNAEACTLNIKEQVKKIVSKKFDLEEYSLRFNSIKDGCIEFIYHVSKATMSYLIGYRITGGMMGDFAACDIIFLQINEMKLIVLSEIIDAVSNGLHVTRSGAHLGRFPGVPETVFLVYSRSKYA